jgi:hypothetical protein
METKTRQQSIQDGLHVGTTAVPLTELYARINWDEAWVKALSRHRGTYEAERAHRVTRNFWSNWNKARYGEDDGDATC